MIIRVFTCGRKKMNNVNYLEGWIIELLKQIEEAADRGGDYNLHLDKEIVQKVAFESRSLKWIELY